VPAADADAQAAAARTSDSDAVVDAAPASTDAKDSQTTTGAEAATRTVVHPDTVAHAEVVERPTRGSIEVEMRGFKNARGQVLVALWRTGRGFPDHAGRAFGKARTNVQGGQARVVFEDVPPGAFAVVAHHDENRDFRMDTGLLGIPAEGYGFSRDASASFGPPSFDDARLWLAAGKQRRVRIHMRY